MWKTVNFPELAEKCANFKSNPKCVICSNSSLFLFKMDYVKSTIVLEHVWIKTKHLSHAKSAERKIFWLFTEKVWKINEINTNIKLSCAFGDYRTQNILGYIHVKVDFYWFLIYWYRSKLDHSVGDNVRYGQFSRAWRKVGTFNVQSKKHVLWLHNPLFVFQMDLFVVNNSSRTCLNQK